jgi:hypothetical protein
MNNIAKRAAKTATVLLRFFAMPSMVPLIRKEDD